MQGKIALEEHFAIPETFQDGGGFAAEADWPELKGRLLDIHLARQGNAAEARVAPAE